MSLVPVNVTWTFVRGDTNGSTFRGQGTAFNTDTRAIVPFDQTRSYATLDPRPWIRYYHRQQRQQERVRRRQVKATILWSKR